MDELLHVLRIKGRASPDELAAALDAPSDAIAQGLQALGGQGLALERMTGRRPGWLLTPEGRDLHAEQIHDEVGDEARLELAEHYRGFLRVNHRTKHLCTVWQTTGDDARRFEVLDELRDVQGEVGPVLSRSGDVVARFARYGTRLQQALDRAAEDPRYVVDPLVDSYHTIWFECHEDFLVTLGRARHEEASW